MPTEVEETYTSHIKCKLDNIKLLLTFAKSNKNNTVLLYVDDKWVFSTTDIPALAEFLQTAISKLTTLLPKKSMEDKEVLTFDLKNIEAALLKAVGLGENKPSNVNRPFIPHTNDPLKPKKIEPIPPAKWEHTDKDQWWAESKKVQGGSLNG